jgi:hypothetical protein
MASVPEWAAFVETKEFIAHLRQMSTETHAHGRKPRQRNQVGYYHVFAVDGTPWLGVGLAHTEDQEHGTGSVAQVWQMPPYCQRLE